MAKVFKTLKKKAQATPLVGVILDSLKSENPRQNAPSIQAVLDNLQPKQLLINNSFQVNQRGVSEYTSTGYTLDMWRCYLVSGSKVKPITGSGIKIEKVGGTFSLRQKVPFTENDVGKKYTVSFELETDTLIESDLNFGQQKNTWNFDVGKKVYSHTFTLQSNDIVDGYVDLIIVNIGEVVANINVYYCDLWEGDIAYPHVREDEAIALMRCCDIIQVLKIKAWSQLPFTHDVKNAYVKIPYKFPYNIVGATMTHNMNELTVTGYSDIGISEVSQQEINDKTSMLELYIILTSGSIGGKTTGGEAFAARDEDIVITLSKEPLS